MFGVVFNMPYTGPASNAYGIEAQISDLESEIELCGDKNLKTTVDFFKITFEETSAGKLHDYFSKEKVTETRTILFHAADQRWANKSTLASQRSRISSLCDMAEHILEVAAHWKRGEDPQYIRARERVRTAIYQKFPSPAAFERRVLGKNKSLICHLLKKANKYPVSHSRELLERLPIVAEALGLDPEILRHDLVDKSGETKLERATSKTFPFGLPPDEWPAQLTDAVNEIFSFHKGMKAGNDPLGRPKRRSTKSFWKTREYDGVCSSQNNAIAMLRSFFGYSVLPASGVEARELVLSRLKITSRSWSEVDLPKFDRWMSGEGRDPNEASIAWLLGETRESW